MRHAEAAGVKDCKIILAVAHAEIGRFDEPLPGGRIIRLAAVSAFGQQHREIVHGARVPRIGGGLIIFAGARKIAIDADALFIERAEPVLRGGDALRRGLLEPLGRDFAVAGDSPAVGVAHAQLELRRRIALLRQ